MVDGGADDVEMVLDDSANAASENVTNVSNELAGVVQTDDATETDTNTSGEDRGVTNSNTTINSVCNIVEGTNHTDCPWSIVETQ